MAANGHAAGAQNLPPAVGVESGRSGRRAQSAPPNLEDFVPSSGPPSSPRGFALRDYLMTLETRASSKDFMRQALP